MRICATQTDLIAKWPFERQKLRVWIRRCLEPLDLLSKICNWEHRAFSQKVETGKSLGTFLISLWDQFWNALKRLIFKFVRNLQVWHISRKIKYENYWQSFDISILFRLQYETRKEGEIVLAGANASEDAQGEDDGGDDSTAVSGIDVVLNHQLVETGFGDKKGFTAYLKVRTFVKPFVSPICMYLGSFSAVGKKNKLEDFQALQF